MKEALLHQQTSDANEVEGRNNHGTTAAMPAAVNRPEMGFTAPSNLPNKKGLWVVMTP
jgi:hypothetical protein